MAAPIIRLTVPPAIERAFKRQAKKAFPKETLAFLLGTQAGDTIHVDGLFTPEDMAEHCTTEAIYIQPHWLMDALDEAEEQECVCVGWIHSHPYQATAGTFLRDHSQSETDILDAGQMLGLPISGICVVQEIGQNKKKHLRASMRFWGPSIAVELQ
jgi:hypothetical protein